MSRYATEARGHVDDLKAMLSSDAQRALWEDMSSLCVRPWIDWVGENEGSVVAFVSATPSQRAKRKAWQEPTMKARLVLAAIRHVQQSEILLRVLANTPCLSPGCSYRDTLATAGIAYQDIQAESPPYWPFEGDSPFELP